LGKSKWPTSRGRLFFTFQKITYQRLAYFFEIEK